MRRVVAKRTLRRKCAVCGDCNQTNVRLKWMRRRDGVIFHVCFLCAEHNKVNENSVKELEGKSFSTMSK